MKTMKTMAILFTALLMVGVSFGQMKYKPSKVIVVVLGPKNPTFDESKFSDLHFYYLPGLKLSKDGGIYGKASKNKKKNAWSSVLGVGATSHAEATQNYSGEPAILVEKHISSGTAYIFDKNGLVNAETFNGRQESFNNQTKFMVHFKKMKRSWESETFGNLMKSLVKKGETMKPPKKYNTSHLLERKIYAFQVTDAKGDAFDIQNLTKGNSATLLVFLYINPEFDFNKGKESGAGKKGKDYMNQVAQTAAADKQIAPLYNLEKGIFGKKLKR
ncbi:hypothetical protein MNBD_BACTEROID07-1477 [hydrothermal vent metagenome]|uniref:Uncharacterized protein n=1 Tax=hydrothermal vent metagenome TaxID=652676 RepID=A0A3B0UIU5_9ZZZZ